MSRPDHLVALEELARILDDLGIPFHVGGSVASSAWGRGRSTVDVDVVIRLDSGAVDRFVEKSLMGFYVDRDRVAQAVGSGRSFNLIHLATMIKIDAFMSVDDDYDREARARVRSIPLEDREDARNFPVSAPEDIVLQKLRWYRSGGEDSERQWADVLDVLRVQQGHLDEPWMEAWAARLDVGDLLSRIVEESRGRE